MYRIVDYKERNWVVLLDLETLHAERISSSELFDKLCLGVEVENIYLISPDYFKLSLTDKGYLPDFQPYLSDSKGFDWSKYDGVSILFYNKHDMSGFEIGKILYDDCNFIPIHVNKYDSFGRAGHYKPALYDDLCIALDRDTNSVHVWFNGYQYSFRAHDTDYICIYENSLYCVESLKQKFEKVLSIHLDFACTKHEFLRKYLLM